MHEVRKGLDNLVILGVAKEVDRVSVGSQRAPLSAEMGFYRGGIRIMLLRTLVDDCHDWHVVACASAPPKFITSTTATASMKIPRMPMVGEAGTGQA